MHLSGPEQSMCFIAKDNILQETISILVNEKLVDNSSYFGFSLSLRIVVSRVEK